MNEGNKRQRFATSLHSQLVNTQVHQPEHHLCAFCCHKHVEFIFLWTVEAKSTSDLFPILQSNQKLFASSETQRETILILP